MTDVRSAWNEAGGKLQGLGASLKQHYAQQRGDDAGQTREQVSDAFKKVGEALQGAIDAVGAAAKDPAVKEEAKQASKSVTEALSVTFSEISEDVKKAFDKRKGEAKREDGEEPAAPEDSSTAAPAADAPSTAAPAGLQESGPDGGTAPQDPSSTI
ncbi:MAG: hypothetical protein ACKVZ6_02105 [Kineosporiaceae bacterium]